MSKTMISVRSALNGSMYAVETSGISCISDSWIDANPRIDEPSNSCPTEKNSSSTVDAGMLKCCCTPGRSVNRMSRNLTSVSLMNLSTSEESLNIVEGSKRFAARDEIALAIHWRGYDRGI